MNELELLLDLHLDGERQGPGSPEDTRRAIDLAGISKDQDLAIADLGCGTGAATLVLAEELTAQITAVDLFPEFLQRLSEKAQEKGLENRITTLQGSMDDLPFPKQHFDVIWSEGAIYNIGFEKGVRYLHPFLKPGGRLAVSEITWLTDERPEEIESYWQTHYPEIGTADMKIKVLAASGYKLLGHFFLPPSCWLEGYYLPLEKRYEDFLQRHQHSESAVAVVTSSRQEAELYQRYQDTFSYGFYIAQKT